ncbi:MAG TPA: type II 3-dehydroquinate dehydratase [Candidatus Ruthenibacterium merdavium]|uniref:3-dehydroquinate dehydratase n=1 Tax=Candidatus Ruthenibacterium merdavium TaxID=2838752 RepID=A0A9D2Q7D3_9FIRM|nr:type II 3-dehydroquinate dehydratase [Candidatus Ruthenibacterium merdavium]
MKFLIVNGPNLNMLGIREPEVYGSMTYEELVYFLHEQAVALGVEIEVFQSNCEGEIVNEIQRAYRRIDGIIINPAAYTHTSIAILDALKAVSIPAAEVHLSDVTKREEFRQVSYAGMACEFHFIGEGKQGYINAMKALKEKLEAAH